MSPWLSSSFDLTDRSNFLSRSFIVHFPPIVAMEKMLTASARAPHARRATVIFQTMARFGMPTKKNSLRVVVLLLGWSVSLQSIGWYNGTLLG
jgi:hypothetical protein